ncbi:hypothetical protein EXE58_06100 [Nocardioides seonyuensis]|uniref:Uncharacterized protein n=1 Tax=Nocardioides seonyuensis TaxID=2518371 RepID=A0A4P7IDB9_9ACTN|nr:hypothetical protein [Nocardioides seonyuensis]QBX55068.1 hypothetical protein EXE58_06100 [Nocardioides seonyuensis]
MTYKEHKVCGDTQTTESSRSGPGADSPTISSMARSHVVAGVGDGLRQVVDTSRFDCIEGVAEVVFDGFRFRAVQQPLLQPWGSGIRVKVDAVVDFEYLDRSARPAPRPRWAGLTPNGWDVVAEAGVRTCDPQDHLHCTVVVENVMTARRLYYRGVRKGDLWEIHYLAWATGVLMPGAGSDKPPSC